MMAIKDKSNCSGCSACVRVCPKNCITMERDSEGYLYPKVNNSECISCGLCNKVCPILNNSEDDKKNPIAYAAYNKNEEIRLKSSSGGLFSLLAENIINQNGVVYGATFIDGIVKHIRVDNINDLCKLYKSKYIQSEIGETYVKAQEDLNSGKLVLFTGTPCQIEGLYSFLRKEYKNLYTQDIICHGVPSLKAWNSYLKYLEIDNPLSVDFRNKKIGWEQYNIVVNSHSKNIVINHEKDIFMKSFLSNLNLRPSCYNCMFKKIHRKSDITLADFWGVSEVCPEMNDNKGTSLILIHSEKGKELFENIKENIEYKEVNFDDSVRYNPSYFKSCDVPKNRRKFFENLDIMPFDVNVNRCTNLTIIGKIKRKIKNIIKKLLRMK